MTLYNHDKEVITLTLSGKECDDLPMKLPKGWKRKLESINKKIKKNWAKDADDEWTLSIANNEEIIESDDLDRFNAILSKTPSPITIIVNLVRRNFFHPHNIYLF